MPNDRWRDETVPVRPVRPEGEDIAGVRRWNLAPGTALRWILGLLGVLVALAICGLWSLYLLGRPLASDGPTPTPIIWTPTAAPTPSSSPTVLPTETSEPTPTVSPDIAVGGYVRVAGTGGDGLNLREGPGKDYVRKDIALDGEVFLVVDGPAVASGSPWWKLRDVEDGAREWWAVGNFLEPIEQPGSNDE